MDIKMKQLLHKNESNASITVFLSLVLLLILSFLFTLTEGARISTAKVEAERALSTAMDSVLAEYYGPLWEEYHIFGFYAGKGGESDRKVLMEGKLTDYMSYTFEPDKNINLMEKPVNKELFHPSLKSVKITEETMLMDYNGKLLINEAVEYMKYREIGNGVEQLLSKLSLLETPQKVSYLCKESQKAAEKLVEIDKGILRLMELLDGLKTSKQGIVVTRSGALKTEEYFVKKICFSEISAQAVGINQSQVFQALRNQYVNPDYYFNTISNNIEAVRNIDIQISYAQAQEQAIIRSMEAQQTRLIPLYNASKMTNGIIKQIEAIYNTINNMGNILSRLADQERELQASKAWYINNILEAKNNIYRLISEIKPLIVETQSTLDDILFKTETAAPVIKQYEEVLNAGKELIGENIYAGLEENLNEMKRYVTVEGGSYNFRGMKTILQKNFQVLTQVEGILMQSENLLSVASYLDAERTFDNAKSILKGYQTNGLTLDYSTLVLDKSSEDNPISKIKNILQSGISGMVMDPSKISKQKLPAKTLPSDIAAIMQENSDYLEKIRNFFGSIVLRSDVSGTDSLFESFGDGMQVYSIIGNSINQLAEHILYQQYLKEHYGLFSAKEVTGGKPTVLAYELEYLLVGKQSDQENINSVISRIVLLRTILDFTSILGDSTRRNEAKAAAAAIVGFTGLPVLVGITQVLILLAWSFAEALLDVSILMMGKTVPILKKKVSLELYEIFLINRTYLTSKAEKVSNTNELSLSYQDYLRLFLLMKEKRELAFRSMDLMQENINIRYKEDAFTLSNCIYGYKTRAEFSIASKFTAFSFVRRHLTSDESGYCFTAEAENCY